jgi:hypothetical protein
MPQAYISRTVDDRAGRRLLRASPWETVGAWLHIWTPRRDTYIPPVPVWRLLAAAGLSAVAVTATALIVADSKERAQERERSISAAADARRRGVLEREQIPRYARLPGTATAGAAPSELPELRRRMVRGIEAAITADAQARYSQQLLDAHVETTRCVPYVRPRPPHPPEPPLTAARGKYECVAVTRKIEPTAISASGDLGYPFWAAVDFRHGRVIWCKVNPRSAERGIGGDVYVALPRECDLARG